jgi:hypothetical protein
MAKAILGYMSATDPRTTNRLATENRLLRQRVSDLEAAVVRLQKENDALAVLVTEHAEDSALTPA